MKEAYLGFGPVNMAVAKRFVGQHHYARNTPPHCLESLALYQDDLPVGVAIWGWGVRPRHTIQRLFSRLNTKDYRELNRLCVHDSMPTNTESYFLAACIRWFRYEHPEIKVLISWADGMRGKPGYVYQAANWLYAGFIETEFYITRGGEVVHPRQLITRYGRRDQAFTEELGLRKARGRQFLYVYFLCGHAERKLLVRGCPIEFSRQYPKAEDCRIWYAGEESRETRQATDLKSAVRFRAPALQSIMEGIGI